MMSKRKDASGSDSVPYASFTVVIIGASYLIVNICLVLVITSTRSNYLDVAMYCFMYPIARA